MEASVHLYLCRADQALIVKVSADYVRVSITRGISHEEAGEELLDFMRCAPLKPKLKHAP